MLWQFGTIHPNLCSTVVNPASPLSSASPYFKIEIFKVFFKLVNILLSDFLNLYFDILYTSLYFSPCLSYQVNDVTYKMSY